MLRSTSLLTVMGILLLTACTCTGDIPDPVEIRGEEGDWLTPKYRFKVTLPDWVPVSQAPKLLKEIDFMMDMFVNILEIEGTQEEIAYNYRCRIIVMDTHAGFYFIGPEVMPKAVHGHYTRHNGRLHVAGTWRGILDIVPHELLHHILFRLTGDPDGEHILFDPEVSEFGKALQVVHLAWAANRPVQMP